MTASAADPAGNTVLQSANPEAVRLTGHTLAHPNHPILLWILRSKLNDVKSVNVLE